MIYAEVEPTDLDLYESLLPKPLGMPEQPRVCLFILKLDELIGGKVGHFEADIGLRCTFNGKEGWYYITTPLSDSANWAVGPVYGYDKLFADFKLYGYDRGWKGQVFYRDSIKSVLAMDFERRDELGELKPWQAEYMEGDLHFVEVPGFVVVPVHKGPLVIRQKVTTYPESEWKLEKGMTRIKVDQGQPWGPLIPSEGVAVPGLFLQYEGVADLYIGHAY